MSRSKSLFLPFVFCAAMVLHAQTVPVSDAAISRATDRGDLAVTDQRTPISVTLVLGMNNLSGAESLARSLNTPGNPQYHHFLTAAQFASQFAPTSAAFAGIAAGLAKYGLSAQRTTAMTITVTGLPANMERAFGVSLHSYQVPAEGNRPTYTFHAPLAQLTIPAELSGKVAGIIGLDSRPSFHPHYRAAPASLAPLRNSAATTTSAGDAPGSWTVTDFAKYYDVQPLYNQGLTGSGRTLGIVTLAAFTPSDAYAYWSALGLPVSPNRIQIINVDGGPGAPSDASDSEETTLDVEQAGGVAPGANIIVYQAANTNQAWVDAYAMAVEDNTADSISTSWGDWEWTYTEQNAPVTDPSTGQTVSLLQAGHELFLRAELQGQTLFAASMDGGAYAANDGLGCYPSTSPSCSLTVSVEYPASDPAITAAGGTTLAGQQQYTINGTPVTINVPNERVWGWDYLEPICQVLQQDPYTCGIFPGGSGGGVSVQFAEPAYQLPISGIKTSPPGQDFVYNGASEYQLPAYYAGRNLPDISFNADPETGYQLYYTSNVSGFSIINNYGGTSFVAPQLNGVAALLGQDLNGRLGLLNYSLYALALGNLGYSAQGGLGAPFHAIPYGDNWYYYGTNGYNPAVGLGTLDVANFAQYLRRIE